MTDGRVIERRFGVIVAEYKEERTGTVVTGLLAYFDLWRLKKQNSLN